jgi:hypothetical protein
MPSTVLGQQESGQASAETAEDASEQSTRGGMPMMGPAGMPMYRADPGMHPCYRMGMPMHRGMRPMAGQGGMMDRGQRREMMQQHMQTMEQRLANIESLLQELVDLQKGK